MAGEPSSPDNRVVLSYDGTYHAFWRGRVVYDHTQSRIKRFEKEHDVWDYLALCDAVGKLA